MDTICLIDYDKVWPLWNNDDSVFTQIRIECHIRSGQLPQFMHNIMTGQDDIELLLRATEKITNSDDQCFQVESSFIDREAKIRTASASAIIINLLKTILGTGMLALPYAFNKLGLVSGTLLLISCGYFARHGLLVYSHCGMRAGISGDEGISVLCKMVDKRLGPVVNFALFAMCIGSAIGYLCLIGDLLPTLLPFRIGRNLCNAAVTVFILFPLSFVQNMSRLQYTSIIGLFSIVYVFALSICLLVAKDINWSDVPFVKPDHLQLSSVNSIVFVFTCHQSVRLFCRQRAHSISVVFDH